MQIPQDEGHGVENKYDAAKEDDEGRRHHSIGRHCCGNGAKLQNIRSPFHLTCQQVLLFLGHLPHTTSVFHVSALERYSDRAKTIV